MLDRREVMKDALLGGAALSLFSPSAVFAADDPSAIASSLTALLRDRSGWDERRRAARDFVERDRNWSSNISRYEPVYRKLVAGRSGDPL